MPDAQEQMDDEPGLWTVAAWLAYHNVHNVSASLLQDEGLRLGRICRVRGIPVPETRTVGVFLARQWPMEAIRIWWPDFCRRHNRNVS